MSYHTALPPTHDTPPPGTCHPVISTWAPCPSKPVPPTNLYPQYAYQPASPLQCIQSCCCAGDHVAPQHATRGPLLVQIRTSTGCGDQTNLCGGRGAVYAPSGHGRALTQLCGFVFRQKAVAATTSVCEATVSQRPAAKAAVGMAAAAVSIAPSARRLSHCD
jgi:hypothetical protein